MGERGTAESQKKRRNGNIPSIPCGSGILSWDRGAAAPGAEMQIQALLQECLGSFLDDWDNVEWPVEWEFNQEYPSPRCCLFPKGDFIPRFLGQAVPCWIHPRAPSCPWISPCTPSPEEKRFAKLWVRHPKSEGEKRDSLLLVMSYVRNWLRKNGTLLHFGMCCNSWSSPADPICAARSSQAFAAGNIPWVLWESPGMCSLEGIPALCLSQKAAAPVRVRNSKSSSWKGNVLLLWDVFSNKIRVPCKAWRVTLCWMCLQVFDGWGGEKLSLGCSPKFGMSRGWFYLSNCSLKKFLSGNGWSPCGLVRCWLKEGKRDKKRENKYSLHRVKGYL